MKFANELDAAVRNYLMSKQNPILLHDLLNYIGTYFSNLFDKRDIFEIEVLDSLDRLLYKVEITNKYK